MQHFKLLLTNKVKIRSQIGLTENFSVFKVQTVFFFS